MCQVLLYFSLQTQWEKEILYNEATSQDTLQYPQKLIYMVKVHMLHFV